MHVVKPLALSACFLLLVSASSRAQTLRPVAPSDSRAPRVHFAGFSADPTLSMTNVGTDNNVFNSADNPRKDFTFTLSPALNAWARAGKARMSLKLQADLVYFNRFASERSVDGGFGARVEVPLVRLSPWVDGGSYSGRQRVGYEIDARSRRTTKEARIGVDLRAASKTTISASVGQTATSWDGDTVIFGARLKDGLDDKVDTAALEYRQRLSVLTTLVAEVGGKRDRFPFSPDRNTDSVFGMAGFDLKSRALISGTARIGYRQFKPIDGHFASYQGLVTNADVTYVLHSSTRLQVEANRDVSFSFEPLYPYYLQTGARGTITQQITSSWDVQARYGGQVLGYRAIADAGVPFPDRVDRVHQTGGGVGYRLKQGVRVAFNVDRYERRSPFADRRFSGLRSGASLTYAP